MSPVTKAKEKLPSFTTKSDIIRAESKAPKLRGANFPTFSLISLPLFPPVSKFRQFGK